MTNHSRYFVFKRIQPDYQDYAAFSSFITVNTVQYRLSQYQHGTNNEEVPNLFSKFLFYAKFSKAKISIHFLIKLNLENTKFFLDYNFLNFGKRFAFWKNEGEKKISLSLY